MITFLAGNITENNWNGHDTITNRYGFASELRSCLKQDARCLYICSDPTDYACNDATLIYYREAFRNSDFGFLCFDLVDNRYVHDFTQEKLASYDLIILGSGRVPTQHYFFEELGLREALHSDAFDGVVIGISAGALNCAKETYNWPEEQGDTINPANPRFYAGLGLVNAQVLPHFQARYDMYVDGRHLYSDITVRDSIGRNFLAIPDYSYVIAKDGVEDVRGPWGYYQNGFFADPFANASVAAA
ncbi:MAG: Type 1 glutamine amidotransferase-like domain-containing protein [Lachnospiraceae bacterium]|nr:Type 1 glutamine amidotransferase-like domain-containing protein [Lachnospiraceae bacterium]